jgi:hypothetical protein
MFCKNIIIKIFLLTTDCIESKDKKQYEAKKDNTGPLLKTLSMKLFYRIFNAQYKLYFIVLVGKSTIFKKMI